jgi:cytochrome c oxidase cbb3-type subunit III
MHQTFHLIIMKTEITEPSKCRMLYVITMLVVPVVLQAQTSSGSASYFSNTLFNTLLAIIILLAIAAVAIGGALKNIITSDIFTEYQKRKKSNESTHGKTKGTILLVCLGNLSMSAQQQKPLNNSIGGLDQVTFYTMVSIIALEIIVIGILITLFRTILSEEKIRPVKVAAGRKISLLDRINATVELEKEDEILMDHEYDGIRELDNNLPPWWKYGFYLSIAVSVIYMIIYHVTGSAPLQAEEYKRSIRNAEVQVAEFMKNSKNNVDETTVKMLTDVTDLETGKNIFQGSCAACHGRNGEGGVGPNLTDEYWLHSGSVSEIFKTIKYGWPDKGMKAWKDDFSPVQIAQMTSYIRTLKNTNPPNGKEKQGDIYIETTTPNDTVKQVPAEANNLSQVLTH